MKTTGLPKPVNSVQQEFLALCEKGGGVRGGPPRGQVQELLRSAGRQLNQYAFGEVKHQFSDLSDRNPWHICFAIGLSWGHLAKLEVNFTAAASDLLSNWNSSDLASACSYHLERGQAPIRESLSGAFQLFQTVKLPDALPNDLETIGRAQERWLSPIILPSRPKYIGSWNATAMFMVALFAQPELARTMKSRRVLLPPGGPVFNALTLLFKVFMLSRAPAGSELDENAFEPGAIYENNAIMELLLPGLGDWSMIDLHSGLYMLGTRDPRSKQWFSPS